MQKTTVHAVIILGFSYIFFKYLLDFFAPFLIGLGIALLFEPVVRFLTIYGRFKRGLASFVTLVILASTGVSIGIWGVSSFIREAGEFLEAAPYYIADLQKLLSAYPFLPVSGLLEWAAEWLGTQSIRAVGHVPGILIWILLILVSAFFFSRDKDIILIAIAKWCPEWLAQYTKPISRRLSDATTGFLKSEFILFSMVAVVSIIALWLLNSPYAILLGLAIALLDSLPIVGAGLVLWPWAGYLSLVGQRPQAAVLIVLYAIVTVIRNILGPRILGNQIDMHPLVALMSIFIGIKAFGIAGLLAGPALVIITKTMLDLAISNDLCKS